MISPADVVTIASSALLIRSPGILLARRMRLVTPLEAVRRRVGAAARPPMVAAGHYSSGQGFGR